jgi:orotate phosphoribosyltransferase
MVASGLGVPFAYSERVADPASAGLYPVRYRLPGSLRQEVRGKRVAIVNDVINAGSAVRGTLADLKICGAETVAVGTLAVLGPPAGRFAAENHLALETLAFLPAEIWPPARCPLCAHGILLTDPTAGPR